MADPNQVSAGNGISNIASLLQLAGGNKATSTTSSDTSALKGVLGDLKGQDPAKLLETIFARASGEIPGLQSAMSNAVGARTGGNSAVQAILQKLLQQTTLLGQQQLVDQQQKNFQTQAQVADSIARGNSKTTQTSGTNLGKAAQTLAMLSAGQKLLNSDIGAKAKDLFSGAGNLLTGGGGTTSVAPAALSFSGGGGGAYTNPVSTGIADFSPIVSGASDLFSGAGNALSDFFGSGGTPSTSFDGVDTPEMSSGGGWLDTITKWFGFADGGLVDKNNLPAYAEGGLVRSGGGRRSSAPSFELPAIMGTTANQGFAPPLAVSGKTGKVQDERGGSDQESSLAGEATGSIGLGTALGVAANVAMGNVPGAIAGLVSAAHPNAALGVKGLSVAMNPNPMNVIGLLTALMANQGGQAPADSAFGLSSASDNTGFGTNAGGIAGDAGFGLGGTNASLGEAGNTGFGGGVGIGMGNAGGIGAGIGESIGEGMGESESSPGGDSSGGGPGGMKKGGPVKGPGTGTSDSIPAMLSHGEYVIPADVVQKMGVDFFDGLKNQFHQKAA